MPELPDVEVFRRLAQDEALWQRVERAEVRDADLLKDTTEDELRRALEGHALEATFRHGKTLLIRAGSGRWLLLHFGLSGGLSCVARDEDEPRFARLVLRFDDGVRLVYTNMRRLGHISIVDDPQTFVRDEGLGTDALDPALDRQTFIDMLAGRRGTIKTALTDQSLIAGIGNEYADEIFFQAGMDPRRPVQELDRSALEALHATMQRVLKEAVDCGADTARMPDDWLLPHRKKGAKCPRCGRPLERPKVSGRTTYLCAHCQNGYEDA